MKIYTRTGDRGQTSLFGGKRVGKDDIRVEAYGTLDELNSVLGVVIAEVSSSKYKVLSIKKELLHVQSDLFFIGTSLASPSTKYQIQDIKYLENRVKEMEEFIDTLTRELSELGNFILPGGGEAGSLLHLSRSICRRCERRIISLAKKENVESVIIMYINRLSDLLFIMARFINDKQKQKETIWRKESKR